MLCRPLSHARPLQAWDANLASLYLKLMPNQILRLEAWANDERTSREWPEAPGENRTQPLEAVSPLGAKVVYGTVESRTRLLADKWYSIVAQSDGRWGACWKRRPRKLRPPRPRWRLLL